MIVLAVLGAAGWLAFVPAAQEAPYAFVAAWGEKGGAPGQFNDPTGIAVAGAEVFVADSRNNRIQAFDRDGTFLHKWGGPFAMNIFGSFNGWFATVTGVHVDSAGNVFAADFYNHRVQKFSADGTFLTRFGTQGAGQGQFDHAIAVAVAVAVAGDGTVFVVDFGNSRIQKWRPPQR